MIEHLLHLKHPLLSALIDTNCDVYLHASEWQVISNTCDILKRIKEITVEISSEKTVTISKVVVFSKPLTKFCGQLKNKFLFSPVTTNFINELIKQVENRFGHLERNILYAEAVILDPRFKNHGFLNNNAFIEGKRSEINKASTIPAVCGSHTSSVSVPLSTSD